MDAILSLDATEIMRRSLSYSYLEVCSMFIIVLVERDKPVEENKALE